MTEIASKFYRICVTKVEMQVRDKSPAFRTKKEIRTGKMCGCICWKCECVILPGANTA